ncbi:MAG: hypothetical protein K8T25_09485 [Planctomycetia bacterium]|nr:hypothetical protein [Planctomycetia bacterium]
MIHDHFNVHNPITPDEQLAFDLRTAGHSYQQIADRQKVNVSTAYRRVRRMLDRLRDIEPESVSDMRDLDLNRLSWLERSLVASAASGDRPAGRLLLQVMAMRLRYLDAVPLEYGRSNNPDPAVVTVQRLLRESQQQIFASERDASHGAASNKPQREAG